MIRALVVVALLSATAYGDKAVCTAEKQPTGTPIFESRYLSANRKHGMLTRLYPSGTYTRTPLRTDERPPPASVSCIATSEIDEITKALKAASWLEWKPDGCKALASESTTIFVFGERRAVLAECGSALDRASTDVIALVGVHLGLLSSDRIGAYSVHVGNPLARGWMR